MFQFLFAAGHTDENYLNTFILTAKSDHLSIQTASPPHPPTNLGVVATTCHSIQVSWDCPIERGVEIIGSFIYTHEHVVASVVFVIFHINHVTL